MRALRGREEGFSLTEIMVVVLIIGILVGIGLPTYLGMRRRAQEVAAKDSAILAVKTAKGFSTTEEESFAAVTTGSLEDAEPSLAFVNGDATSSGPLEVSYVVPDAGAGDTIFVAAVQSESGTCFYARTFAQGGTDYGEVQGADCRAADQDSVIFGPSW